MRFPLPRRGAALLAAGLAALTALPAGAQDTAPPWSVELASGRQQLSNGSPDWTETAARLTHGWGTRRLNEIGVVQTERFGLRDEQLTGQLVRPLDARLTVSADASLSPTHRVLPLHHLGATLQYEFARAWLLHGGLRTTQYSRASVTQGSAMLEHYFGPFSALAAWRPVQTQGSSTASTELRGSYHYGGRSGVSLSLSAGQEAVQLSDSELQLADVRASVLGGRHWLTPAWALSYEWSSTRQGDFYTRQGWRLGVQHLF